VGDIYSIGRADELAANLFRASQTERRLRREEIEGKDHANHTRYEVGHAVRRFIIEQDNPPPELLPTPEISMQEVQRREQKRIQHPPAFAVVSVNRQKMGQRETRGTW
jgi:DNA-damage-inducible protein D